MQRNITALRHPTAAGHGGCVPGSPAEPIALVWPLTREAASLSGRYDVERRRALSDEKVKFLLVGGYALAACGHPRATMDIDIRVKPDRENAEAVMRALRGFGAPVHDLTLNDLTTEGTVLEIGVAPRRIDLMTSVTGLDFDEAFARSTPIQLEGMTIHVPSIADPIRNKRAIGRTRVLANAEALEELSDLEPKAPPDPE